METTKVDMTPTYLPAHPRPCAASCEICACRFGVADIGGEASSIVSDYHGGGDLDNRLDSFDLALNVLPSSREWRC